MTVEAHALAAILGMATATYITRLLGLWLVRLVAIRGRTKAALDAVPPAILMAVIAPAVFMTGAAETAAAALTALAAFRLPLLLAVAVGVASLLALRAFIGLP